MSQEPWIVWLNEKRPSVEIEEYNRTLGGKLASLLQLSSFEVPIPPGFGVTTHAYRHFMDSNGLLELVKRLDAISSIEKLVSIGKSIQVGIEEGELPSELHNEIISNYGKLGRPVVAVRSSATAEDMAQASFAGQHDTFLGISGNEKLSSAIRNCWSSLFSERTLVYRKQHGITHSTVEMSVGVQTLLHARAAGVIFTLDPVNGDPSQIVIEGSWGLGEAVVKGEVIPDKYVLSKVTLEILSSSVSKAKNIKYLVNRDGQVDRVQTVDSAETPCLKTEEVIELGRRSKYIERCYGAPMDIEWAVTESSKGNNSSSGIYFLQARRETVWSQKKKSKDETMAKVSALDGIVNTLTKGLSISS